MLLKNLRIADLTGPNLTLGRWAGGDIRVADGLITQTGPGLSDNGDQVIECEGRFAVPGMIDAHIHLRATGHIGPTAQVPVPGGAGATDPAALLSRLHGFLYCGVVAAGADSLAHPVILSPVTDEFCWLLAAKRIPVVSTLAIGERYPRLADHPEFLDGPLYTACLSGEERAELRGAESTRQRENRWADWMRVMTPVAQDNLRRLITAGGMVVTGTDLSLGADYHRELELLQDAGLAPWDVLRCATVNGAAFLGRTHDLGSLAPGYAADRVLLDADPGQDARNLTAVWRVAKGGQLIDRDALNRPLNRPLSQSGAPGQ